jgi:hypothetical protein
MQMSDEEARLTGPAHRLLVTWREPLGCPTDRANGRHERVDVARTQLGAIGRDKAAPFAKAHQWLPSHAPVLASNPAHS